jgi:hypothetical protein
MDSGECMHRHGSCVLNPQPKLEIFPAKTPRPQRSEKNIEDHSRE